MVWDIPLVSWGHLPQVCVLPSSCALQPLCWWYCTRAAQQQKNPTLVLSTLFQHKQKTWPHSSHCEENELHPYQNQNEGESHRKEVPAYPECSGQEGSGHQLRAAWWRKGTLVAMWGLRLLEGNSCSVIMLIFDWFFCCTVLVEGPLEYQTLHYGTRHCSMLAFCLNALSSCLRSANHSLILTASEQLLYLYRRGSRIGEDLAAVFIWVLMWFGTFVYSSEFSNHSDIELL